MYKPEVLISSMLKLLTLIFVITSFALWIVAGVDTRAKFKEEQTFISGAIWSQTILPIGILIAFAGNEEIYDLIHAFYLFSGAVLLVGTGLFLIIYEVYKCRQPRPSSVHVRGSRFDQYYFGIGISMFIASMLAFADFILLIL